MVSPAHVATRPERAPGAHRALVDLIAGNRRFVAGRPVHGHDIAAAAAASATQRPSATVVGCIDSRVPLEAVFDQTFGMICVIRSGGHVLDRAVLGSIEYAVTALAVPLVMVLGHQRCGAVTAAVTALRDGPLTGGHTRYLIDEIGAAAAGIDLSAPDAIDRVTAAHTDRTVRRLAAEFPGVSVVGARYELDSGRVHLLR